MVHHSNEPTSSGSLESLTVKETNYTTKTPQKPLFSGKSEFCSWLLLCFTTGPVASMTRTYVPAAIQSLAVKLGRTSTGELCSSTGNDCFVKFGVGKVHHTSYVLYLKSIYTALEGLIALLVSGIADYSNYRKWFLIVSIMFYGLCALPFAGLTDATYAQLHTMSALYGWLNITNGVYQIIEASYIPLFMRAKGMEIKHEEKGKDAEVLRREIVLRRGSKVSVLGLLAGNLGGVIALVTGIIISYTRGGPAIDGSHNFLLAITIAGCVTASSTLVAVLFIPSVEGKSKPVDGGFTLLLTFKRMWSLLKQIRQYPNAFLLCISWVIWNATYTNFLSVFILLFRSTLGIGTTDSEYTVYTWLSYVISSLGSLAWMFSYPHAGLKMKTWAYNFLAISLFTNFWGTLGISNNTKIGFKHRWEFWVFDVLYSGSSSALRSLNRVLYSTLLPEGDEAQFFGLEVLLGVAIGWIGDLVNATIQDRTGIDRMPFVPNTVLVLVSLVLYILCDTEKGMADAQKLLIQAQANESTV